jgi:hypothetical protein
LADGNLQTGYCCVNEVFRNVNTWVIPDFYTFVVECRKVEELLLANNPAFRLSTPNELFKPKAEGG